MLFHVHQLCIKHSLNTLPLVSANPPESFKKMRGCSKCTTNCEVYAIVSFKLTVEDTPPLAKYLFMAWLESSKVMQMKDLPYFGNKLQGFT